MKNSIRESSIGIDIGATKIFFGLQENKLVKRKKKIATPKTKNKLIKELEENIGALLNPKVKKIGIGIPGILNYKNGNIIKCPNLKYLNNLNLKKILENKFKVRVFMENDANCFTLAEAVLGAGKNSDFVLGITLGSGLGAGLIIKDGNRIKIQKGAFGSAGEVGHITIKFDGERCSCGNSGCFECYASAKFFKQKGLSPKKLFEKAERKNKKALEIFKEYGKNLGIGLSAVANIFDPEVIVIGGEISNAQKYFLSEAKKEIKKRVFSPVSRKKIKIKISKLGETAGVIGAGMATCP